MACCALVAFLIGQLYAWITAASAALGFVRPEPAVVWTAAQWRAGQDLPSQPRKRSIFQPKVAAPIFAASFAALIIAIAAFAHDSAAARLAHVQAMLADPLRWCGTAIGR